MIQILNKIFYKNGYLLIIAAWLYTISFIFSNYWSYASSPYRVKQQIENYLKEKEQEFELFAADTKALRSIVNKRTEPIKALPYLNSDIGLFVYVRNYAKNPELVFWNNNTMIPAYWEHSRPDGKYFSQYQNGNFEIIKTTLYTRKNEIIVYGMVPVYWNYFIKNKYLPANFPAVNNAADDYKIEMSKADVWIKNGDGKVIFGLKETRSSSVEQGPVSLSLRILAILFVLLFLHAYAMDLVRSRGWLRGFLFLFTAIVVFRAITYLFPFPFNYRLLSLFSPEIYASNWLHPSLGDLFINIVLVFWLVNLLKWAVIDKLDVIPPIRGKAGWYITGICAVFLVIISFVFAGIIRSLISDSQISFHVTDYFSLTIYSLISFVVLCFIVLSFFHLSHIALLFLRKTPVVPQWGRYLLVALAGMIYLSFNLYNASSSSNLLVLAWLLIYMLIMEVRLQDAFVPFLRSSFFLIWVIFFAASVTILIIYQNKGNAYEKRVKKASDLATEADQPAQMFMNMAISDIDTTFLAKNFERFYHELPNRAIKDSLIRENFSGNLNRYETRIFTFDPVYRPLFNEDSAAYSAIANIIGNRSEDTGIPDVRMYKNDFYRYSYIYNKTVTDATGHILGYFFVITEPKSFKSQAVYPELFRAGRERNFDNLNLTYAVYNKGELVNSFGEYNFLSRIPKSRFLKQQYKEEKNGDYRELWYNAANNKLVILVTSESLFFEATTLFAYLFVSILFVVIVLQGVLFLVRSKFRFLRITPVLFRMSIRKQIKATIIFISIFSFFVIGVSTISFYIKRFTQNNRERLVKAIRILANEIETEFASSQEFNNVDRLYEPGANSTLEKSIKEIAEIHGVDVNLYDLNGNLKVSTQPYIYKKLILSPLMEPRAFNRLHYNKHIQVIQEEDVSNFSFLSIYVPVRHDNGKAFAYVNIPYLNTQRELNQEISNFLVTLINLNAFIFVIAGAISVFLTNRITASFSLIAAKMRAVNLGKANEEIVWHSEDEIGALVGEYNKMVKKLEESASALAKSEREGAWREMAKQVAHEIKNPLTPMKLSIQYLQRAIEEKNPNVDVLSQRVSATLVEQIDQLAKIASDFSQFANIGNSKVEDFDLREILSKLADLYRSNDSIKITYTSSLQAATIRADRNQIHRLFTNLLQNAVEAGSGKNEVTIVLHQSLENDKVKVEVTDNGNGIAPEAREKIFTPNFTTKNSGTGLGLAICKGIVEKAHGNIWFESLPGSGTTFYVVLPLV